MAQDTDTSLINLVQAVDRLAFATAGIAPTSPTCREPPPRTPRPSKMPSAS